MKIIDRYILKKFLSAFFFVVLIEVLVICVIDYTEKSDDFMEQSVSWGEIFFDYYANYIPHMVNMLGPIAVFIAAVFVTANMASHTEIIAILSGGISFRRLLLPYIAGAAMLSGITFYMVGWIMPRAAIEKVKFEVKYTKDPFYYEGRDVHIKLDSVTYAYMQSYNNRISTGYKFTIEKFDGANLIEKLSGERILWDSTKVRWKIEQYRIHRFMAEKEDIIVGAEMDTSLKILPKDFESTYKLQEMLTFPELEAYINEQKARGLENPAVFVNEKYERYAYPYAIVLLTVMGVIVSARKSRRGTGFQIAFGFVIAFIYILFVMLSRSFAEKGGMDPMLAAWFPNMLFTLITVGMYFTVQK